MITEYESFNPSSSCSVCKIEAKIPRRMLSEFTNLLFVVSKS